MYGQTLAAAVAADSRCLIKFRVSASIHVKSVLLLSKRFGLLGNITEKTCSGLTVSQ